MKCAGCGRGVGNDTIEAKFLFMRHELECLEAIHVEELASLQCWLIVGHQRASVRLCPNNRAIGKDKDMAKVNLPACWECAADGDSWEYDCDQCNVDNMYTPEGKVKANYI